VKTTAHDEYLKQFKQSPKLLFRHPEELSKYLQSSALQDEVLNYMGFNGLYDDTSALQAHIKNHYPVPPMKLKTDNIDTNKFDLNQIHAIDDVISKNNYNLKGYHRDLKRLINQNEKTEKHINNLQAKVDVFKIRAKQVGNNSELSVAMNGQVSEFNKIIANQTLQLNFDRQHQHELEELVFKLQKETDQLSDTYTSLINNVESAYQDKSNYEYSPDQLRAAKDKIRLNVISNPVKWIEKLKLKPQDVLSMVNVGGLASLMSDQLCKNVKSFGGYKLVAAITENKTPYYIFIKPEINANQTK
jgi:hypothetical protein